MRLAATSRTLAAASCALAVLLAGCGGGGDGGSSGDAAGLEQAALDYTQALLDGDVDAVLASMSAECRDQVDETQLRMALGFAQLFLGDLPLDSLEAETRNVADGRGEARLHLPDGDAPEGFSLSDEWREFVYEDGAWRDPDCTTGTTGLDGTDGTDGGSAFPDVGDLDYSSASTSITIDGDRLEDSWNDLTAGSWSISVTGVDDLGSSISDPAAGATQRAAGRFVGVSLAVANETDGPVDLFFDLTTELVATDGTRSWDVQDDPTRLASEAAGTEDPLSDLAPGATRRLVLVYDVPANAEIVGLAWGLHHLGQPGGPLALSRP